MFQNKKLFLKLFSLINPDFYAYVAVGQMGFLSGEINIGAKRLEAVSGLF